VKPLAFGQYGELGPGFEQLLDQLAEEGADEAARRYLIPNCVAAKGVQLRLLRKRVVMTAQKVIKRHRRMCSYTACTTHYRGGAPRRRGATRKTSSTVQPRQGRGLAATSMRFRRRGPPGPFGVEPADARALVVCRPPHFQKKERMSPHSLKVWSQSLNEVYNVSPQSRLVSCFVIRSWTSEPKIA
jgi:hypothetical protein